MQKIDIATAQHVTIEYDLASLRDRGLAMLIDLIIILAFFLFLLFGAARLSLPIQALIREDYILIGSLFVYPFLSEVLANGQSFGKKILKIQVVRLDGKPPEFTDYLLRTVFLLTDLVLSAGILAALFINATEKRQRLGDLTANTAVIRLRPRQQLLLEDILRIESIDQYIPSFPEVKHLSEQDMLLVKSVVTRYTKYNNEAHRHVVDLTYQRIASALNILEEPQNKLEFLKTILRDYIVLTR
jgi:uncharacterized RDD family membrane protein YckC